MNGLTEGRMVHYVMPNGQHRPAVVVRVWNDIGCSNLQVFTDGQNDVFSPGGAVPDAAAGMMWCTSVLYSEAAKPGTWHWIEKA